MNTLFFGDSPRSESLCQYRVVIPHKLTQKKAIFLLDSFNRYLFKESKFRTDFIHVSFTPAFTCIYIITTRDHSCSVIREVINCIKFSLRRSVSSFIDKESDSLKCILQNMKEDLEKITMGEVFKQELIAKGMSV